jgi:hypothetical protein
MVLHRLEFHDDWSFHDQVTLEVADQDPFIIDRIWELLRKDEVML